MNTPAYLKRNSIMFKSAIQAESMEFHIFENCPKKRELLAIQCVRRFSSDSAINFCLSRLKSLETPEISAKIICILREHALIVQLSGKERQRKFKFFVLSSGFAHPRLAWIFSRPQNFSPRRSGCPLQKGILDFVPVFDKWGLDFPYRRIS